MTKYWVIAPFDATQPDYWQRIWADDLARGVITVGWAEVGNILDLDKASLRSVIDKAYPTRPKAVRGLFTSMLWSFCHEIQAGDFVIARRGTRRVAGVGVVTSIARYDADYDRSLFPSTESGHPFSIGVQWRLEPRDMPLEGPPFAIHALYETTADILERIGAASPAQTGIGATSEAAEFILEKYLEEFIVSNFDSIFRGSLQLYADDDGQKVGQQFPTDVGPIDILAHDAANDALVVIELKKGRESDRVVGQVLRYMGWVKENLAESNQTVRGLIICQERDDRLKYAIRMVRDVSVKCYKVDFKLMDPSSQ